MKISDTEDGSTKLGKLEMSSEYKPEGNCKTKAPMGMEMELNESKALRVCRVLNDDVCVCVSCVLKCRRISRMFV